MFENDCLEEICRTSQPKGMSLDFEFEEKKSPERLWTFKRSGKGEGRIPAQVC